MLNDMTRATMSVRVMRTQLGISKVESYWLVHKGVFEATVVNGKMRVYVDSFEQWYNNQLRYRKVNGPEPAMLEGNSMTLKELAEELGISDSTAYKVVCTDNQIKHTLKDGSVRFSREDFDEWYFRQLQYRKVIGEPPGQAYAESISPHEMCDLLGIRLRNAGYCLTQKGYFRTFKVNGHLRIDKASFEKWYKSQSHYKKIKNEGGRINGIHREEEE